MKTLQLKLAIASIFLMTSFAVSAQTNDAKTTSRSTVSETQKQRPIKNSEYFGMERKITTWSISGQIPPSFPKHQKGQTKEEYNAIMKAWGKKNLNLIKKEYHTKIMSDKKDTK